MSQDPQFIEKQGPNAGMMGPQAKALLTQGWTVYPDVSVKASVGAQIATLQNTTARPVVRLVDIWVPPRPPWFAQVQIANGLKVAAEKGLDRATLEFLSQGFFGIDLTALIARVEGLTSGDLEDEQPGEDDSGRNAEEGD